MTALSLSLPYTAEIKIRGDVPSHNYGYSWRFALGKKSTLDNRNEEQSLIFVRFQVIIATSVKLTTSWHMRRVVSYKYTDVSEVRTASITSAYISTIMPT
jgi:hypothetical protein